MKNITNIFVRSAVLPLLALLVLAPVSGYSQQPDSVGTAVAGLSRLSSRDMSAMDRKYAGMQADLEKQAQKVLLGMQRKEDALQKKLAAKDSGTAQRVFNGVDAQYRKVSAQLSAANANTVSGSARTYLSRVDSLESALRFITASGGSGLPAAKLQQLQALSGQLQQLEGKWAQAAEVQDFVRQREQVLQSKLGQLGSVASLGSINKEAWYYQQQLQQYKSELNDPEKVGELILGAVQKIPAFQAFWQKNSLLAQLFPLPAGYGTPMALDGLQSRAQLQGLFKGSAGISANPDYANAQMGQAQSSLDKLKDKVTSLGGTSGSGDMTLPNFVPDGQHGKFLWRRLEYGFNIQNANQTTWIPMTSNLALTLGYKISDKAVVGVGSGFILGLGNGIQSIHFSSQGVSFRAYTDIRVKGGWWLSGGYERTYYQALTHLADLSAVSNWQPGLLTGLMRKWPVGKRSASMQLLYNWLYAEQVPHAQALQFRIGYTF
jgi:hypothetical protein